MKEAKKSKTVWFNSVMGLVPVILEGLGLTLGPQGTVAYGVVMALGNLVLRTITKQPMQWVKPKGRPRGNITVFLMAAIFAVSAIILGGCTTVNQIYNPGDKSVCDDAAFAQNSLICQVTEKYETTPEAMNGILLDASSIATVVKPESREPVCEFLVDLKSYYLIEANWLSLTQFLELEAQQSRQIDQIINRRIPVADFSVDKIIGPEDDGLLRKAWKMHYDNLYCDDFSP